MVEPPKIRIAAAIIKNERGHMLVVRKRGTSVFIQPGGKIQPGESSTEALTRELSEELRCTPTGIRFGGRFAAPAVNEPGYIVEAEIFFVEISGRMTPAAEIEEIQWIDLENPQSHPLAPLTAQFVVPLAASGRALNFKTQSA
jgi:8-oxo-dGTP pyrophosphatase MutT (NUDIX family)